MHPKFFGVSLCCVLLASALRADSVIVNFDPSTPSVGPFPTNFLTTPNAAQKTGLSVHLPMPDCTAQPSACTEVSLLNELDGLVDRRELAARPLPDFVGREIVEPHEHDAPPAVKVAGITSITVKAQVGTNPATFQNKSVTTPPC